MAIVSCPKCERKLRLSEELRGRRVKCPTCGSNFLPAAPEESPFEEVGEEAASSPPEQRRSRRPRWRGKPHRGTLILVLGLLVPPLGWVWGNKDLAEMQAGRMDRSGEGMTSAGRVIGIVGSILWLLFLLCGVGTFLFFLYIGRQASRFHGF
jgi:hypothetical protein